MRSGLGELRMIEYELYSPGTTTIPSASPGPCDSMIRRMAWQNRSPPALPSKPGETPSLCRPSPVLATGPPVEKTVGPASPVCPGINTTPPPTSVGITSRQICPATTASAVLGACIALLPRSNSFISHLFRCYHYAILLCDLHGVRIVYRQSTQRRGLSEAQRSASQYFAHTADLSAFAGCSAIPLHLLKLIIGPVPHPI